MKVKEGVAWSYSISVFVLHKEQAFNCWQLLLLCSWAWNAFRYRMMSWDQRHFEGKLGRNCAALMTVCGCRMSTSYLHDCF